MKERPILFSGPMVRAILEGRKSQTRRVVSDRNSVGNFKASELLLSDPRTFSDRGNYLHAYVDAPKIEAARGWNRGDMEDEVIERLYPRWEAGDRLWVRETWFHDSEHGRAFYRADADHDGTVPYLVSGAGGFGGGVGNARIDRWRPSIHMPRWASRLTLEIKSVRVERVQEISEEDAREEGVEKAEATDGALSYVLGFSDLWDAINAKRGYGWDTNPWVWVIEFERVDP